MLVKIQYFDLLTTFVCSKDNIVSMDTPIYLKDYIFFVRTCIYPFLYCSNFQSIFFQMKREILFFKVFN